MELLARFVCILGREWPRIIVSIPFSRDRATVHRTVAFRWFKSVSANKKSAIPDGMTDFLELLARFELATSSLPRMRSTG